MQYIVAYWMMFFICRAEEYFKRAVAVEPPEAEAFDKYAAFLWQVRNDLWAAEETFLEAMSADPGNSYYAANYAHFLWNTGGDDTCFPLDSPEAWWEFLRLSVSDGNGGGGGQRPRCYGRN